MDLTFEELIDLIGDRRVVFWCCDHCNKSIVHWTTQDDGKMIATCQQCGNSSEPI